MSLSHHILDLLKDRPKMQERVASALHVEAHPTGGGMKVLRLKGTSGRQFEWHPVTQRVYYLRPSGSSGKFVGEVIAMDIVTHGDAINAVNIWNRGFLAGRSLDTTHLQF